jgi:hypothetical protein
MNLKEIYQRKNSHLFAFWAACMVAAIALPNIARADVFTDPAQHFLANYETAPGDKLLKLQVDIDGDGQEEVLLSLSKSNAYKSGNLWVVYIPVQGGFTDAKQQEADGFTRDYALVGFRPDAYYIGQISEINGRGIAAYIPGGEGKGFLKAITLQGDTIHETDLGELDPSGTRYQELFGSPPSVSIQEIATP